MFDRAASAYAICRYLDCVNKFSRCAVSPVTTCSATCDLLVSLLGRLYRALAIIRNPGDIQNGQ